MAVIKSLSVSAENTWSAKFGLGGDYSLGRQAARALVNIYGGSGAITLRRYASDGTTIVSTTRMTSTSVVETPCTGLYDVGCATGDYTSGTISVVVEQ